MRAIMAHRPHQEIGSHFWMPTIGTTQIGLRLHAEWIQEDATLDFLTGDYEYRDDAGNLLGTSMSQHDAGRMMLAKAAGSARVVMDQAHEIQAYVADHFGDTHTLSVPRSHISSSSAAIRSATRCVRMSISSPAWYPEAVASAWYAFRSACILSTAAARRGATPLLRSRKMSAR